MKLSKVASALSFAHLASIGRSARAEESDPKDDDKDKAKKAKAADDDPEEKDDQDHEDGDAKGKAKGVKADDEDPDADAEEDEPEEDDDDKKAKKAKAKASDGDDDEDEMRGNSAAAAARRRERTRCAAIFGSKAAARNPVLAANLAFSTSMTRKEALAVLESTPAAVTPGSGREARNPSLGGGGTQQVSGTQAVASSWDRAFAKANPQRGQK
jgi:hypothetical protein